MDDRFNPGDWNVICDFSGFKVKASQTVRNWDGLRVHRRFVDERNPQDFVRGRADHQTPPWSRSEGTDVTLGLNEVTRDSY